MDEIVTVIGKVDEDKNFTSTPNSYVIYKLKQTSFASGVESDLSLECESSWDKFMNDLDNIPVSEITDGQFPSLRGA